MWNIRRYQCFHPLDNFQPDATASLPKPTQVKKIVKKVKINKGKSKKKKN